ncbi:hypothetical protein C922_05676 [Plasmodium inui San Antonio 1]|uniref:Uncharacterized protein n=1 Tax=Plasmodium inui San Antonio 1 TaxID=1237626 RepID=W6ZXA5_9APIC|nr:hypothetical protein C922_05676 [Plasmodium inui San Antonio 1]EUD63943.1 hypothetical protein C922_05676 [Plasmodium inui San Antonio 1]
MKTKGIQKILKEKTESKTIISEPYTIRIQHDNLTIGGTKKEREKQNGKCKYLLSKKSQRRTVRSEPWNKPSEPQGSQPGIRRLNTRHMDMITIKGPYNQ